MRRERVSDPRIVLEPVLGAIDAAEDIAVRKALRNAEQILETLQQKLNQETNLAWTFGGICLDVYREDQADITGYVEGPELTYSLSLSAIGDSSWETHARILMGDRNGQVVVDE